MNRGKLKGTVNVCIQVGDVKPFPKRQKVVASSIVVNHPIDRSGEVQLMAKGIELNSEAHGLGGQCRLVNMEGVSVLVGFHTWVDNRVQIDSGAADIDWYSAQGANGVPKLAAFNEGSAIVP